jgi:hypothetical protein
MKFWEEVYRQAEVAAALATFTAPPLPPARPAPGGP